MNTECTRVAQEVPEVHRSGLCTSLIRKENLGHSGLLLKMAGPQVVKVLGHFTNLAKLEIFLDFFGNFFLYLKNRHAYQFAGENR